MNHSTLGVTVFYYEFRSSAPPSIHQFRVSQMEWRQLQGGQLWLTHPNHAPFASPMAPIQKIAELSPRTVNKIAKMGGWKHGSALDLQEKMEKKNAAAYWNKLRAPVLQRPSLCHFNTREPRLNSQRPSRSRKTTFPKSFAMNEGEAEEAPEVVVVSDNDNDFEAPRPKKRVKISKRLLDPLTYPEVRQFAPASPVADVQSALPDYVVLDPKKKKTLRDLAQQAASKPQSNRNDAARSRREEDQPQGCAPPPKFDNESPVRPTILPTPKIYLSE